MGSLDAALSGTSCSGDDTPPPHPHRPLFLAALNCSAPTRRRFAKGTSAGLARQEAQVQDAILTLISDLCISKSIRG